MEFSCSSRSLKDILDAARYAVPASPALAVFGGVQIEAAKGKVTATGSDGETTIAASTTAEVTTDGAIVLPHKPITTFLQTIEGDQKIVVTLQDGEVSVKAGKLSPYRFRTTGTRFPQTLTPKGTKADVDLSRLGDALAVVRAAVPADHHGVQVVSDAAGLHLRSTDHYRLHAVTIPEASFGEFTGVLPLGVLERVAAHTPTSVLTDDRGRAVQFSSDSISITSRLLQVPFPNVEAVLSQPVSAKAEVNVPSARSALARLGAVSADRASGADGTAVTVTGDSDGLRFEVSNANVGSGSEELEGSASELRFVADRQFFLAGLLAHQSDSVTLGYQGQHSPVRITSSSPFSSTTIVMPMRA